MSTGNAGRLFKAVVWNVSYLNASVNDTRWNNLSFAEYANSFSGELIFNVTPSTEMSHGFWESFFPPGIYQVNLSLTNWVGQQSTTTFQFVKSNLSSPTVTLQSSANTFDVWEYFSASMTYSFKLCKNVSVVNNFNLNWSLFDETHQLQIQIPSNYISGSQVMIGKYFFLPSTQYRLKAVVEIDGFFAETYVMLQTGPDRANAILVGGDKTVPLISNTTCALSTNILLDASKSTNLAFNPSSALARSGIAFLWNCSYYPTLQPTKVQKCDPSVYFHSGASFGLFRNKIRNLNATYVVNVMVVPLNYECLTQSAQLLVQCLPDFGAGKSSIAFSTLEVVLYHTTIPVLSVNLGLVSASETITGNLPQVQNLVSINVVDPSLQVIFNATVEMSCSGKCDEAANSVKQMTWTMVRGGSSGCQTKYDWCSPFNVQGAKEVLAPNKLLEPLTSCQCNTACTSNARQLCSCYAYLVIRPCVFVGSQVFTMAFEATDSMGNVVGANVNFQMYPKPSGGELVVVPDVGKSFETEFVIETNKWVGTCKSMFFYFSYRLENCTSSSCMVPLSLVSSKRVVKTVLPPGNVIITVHVQCGTQQSCVSSSKSVTVVVEATSTAIQSQFINNFFNSYQTRDVPSNLVILSVIASITTGQPRLNDSLVILQSSWAQSRSVLLSPQILTILSLLTTRGGRLDSIDMSVTSSLVNEISSALVLSSADSSLSLFVAGQGPSVVALFAVLLEDNSQTSLQRRHLNLDAKPDRRAMAALSPQQVLLLANLNALVVEGSILTVASLFPGSPPGSVSLPGYFYSKIWVVQGLNMQTGDLVATLDNRATIQSCITARDVTACCLGGQCCVDSQCQYPSSQEYPFGFTVVQLNGISTVPSDIFEVQVGMFTGDPLLPLDSRTILNGTAVIHVTRRPAVAVSDVPFIIRLPLGESMVLSMIESQKYAPACLRWDAASSSWSTSGLTQSSGFTATKKMCMNISDVVTCSYFIECYSSSTGYFSTVKSKLDCLGVPLGTSLLDACGICNGDNSTCSGCNGIPNMYDSGVKLDKSCSGHGQCQGSPQCVCCSDNKYQISYTQPDGKAVTVCPWFGVMCNRYCSPAPASGSSWQGAVEVIDCSSHGMCESVNGSLACICDFGWENSDGKFCNKQVVVVQSLSRVLQQFFYAGLPVICFSFLVITLVAWRRLSSKHRKILKASEEVKRALVELEVSSQVAAEVHDTSEESSSTASRAEEHKTAEVVMEDLLKRKQLLEGEVIEIPSVTAFLTTSKFEAMSDTCASDPVVLQTFQRLERLKSKISSEKAFRGVADTFHDHVDMDKLAKAASRAPTSLKKPTSGEETDEQAGRGLQQRQRRILAVNQGREASSLPSFLERRKEHMSKAKQHDAGSSSASSKDMSSSTERKSSSKNGAIASV
eukprot:340629-Hanusia_phi.AAC.7